MNDTKFIELLNLYLDHEISAEDATRLETEVQNNPQRRRLYHEYCRMQKGCQLLAKDFAGAAAAGIDRKIVAFESARPGRSPGLYMAAGFAAAAACVAIIFMSRSREAVVPQQTATGAAVGAVGKPAIPASEEISPSAITKVEMTPARRENLQRALAQNALGLSQSANPQTAFASLEQEKQFAWIYNTRLTPMQNVAVETLKFDARPTLRPDAQAVPNTDSLQKPTEMSAFSFKR